MPFSHFGLTEALARAVNHYPSATPVQTEAIPPILSGRDVLATAQTGSGKTTAFVLPLLQRLISSPPRKPRLVQSLILVPTRELAAQVREVAHECTKHLETRPKVVSAFGGVPIEPQLRALRGGADIVVATPGRLLDLVERDALSLDGIESLVLDEADRMLDLGFADEMRRIEDRLPTPRQNLLFSATLPAAVETLAMELLNDPIRIAIESEPEEAPDIVQRAIRVDESKRTPLLRHLIETEKWERVLVFVARQYTADHVSSKLRRNGVRALSFHGDLEQSERSRVLADFKRSDIQVLVATDLAARGIDIIQLPVVINYDLPRSAVDYTHRIGRTGRAGESGHAISFLTAESAHHFGVIEKKLKMTLVHEEVDEFTPQESIVVPSGTGGIKGHRKSKKDKLREAAARGKSS